MKDVCPLCLGRDIRSDYRVGPDRFHARARLFRLMRCQACSLVWTRDPPLVDELPEHYGSAYHAVITRVGDASPDRWIRRRNVVLRYKSSGTLLDIGCSSGAFLETLRGQSWRLFGIDIDANVVAKAKERTGACVFAGNATEAPFEPGTFDVVTCFHALEHVHQPLELVKAVWKWLAPGGIFYLAVPNIDSWEARVFRSYWYGLELPRHLFHFSPDSIRQLASRCGFFVLSLETPSVSYVESSVRYVLADGLGRLGISVQPLAQAHVPTLPWRVMRKALRLTLLAPLSGLAHMVGAGASIEAVFGK